MITAIADMYDRRLDRRWGMHEDWYVLARVPSTVVGVTSGAKYQYYSVCHCQAIVTVVLHLPVDLVDWRTDVAVQCWLKLEQMGISGSSLHHACPVLVVEHDISLTHFVNSSFNSMNIDIRIHVGLQSCRRTS
eukprot:scpid93637/ scgid19518/ 